MILDVASMLNETGEAAIALDDGEDGALFGESGALDSLGLVTLVTSVEQSLADDLGVSVVIADDRAMSRESSPFRTIGTLADYIVVLLEEADDV